MTDDSIYHGWLDDSDDSSLNRTRSSFGASTTGWIWPNQIINNTWLDARWYVNKQIFHVKVIQVRLGMNWNVSPCLPCPCPQSRTIYSDPCWDNLILSGKLFLPKVSPPRSVASSKIVSSHSCPKLPACRISLPRGDAGSALALAQLKGLGLQPDRPQTFPKIIDYWLRNSLWVRNQSILKLNPCQSTTKWSLDASHMFPWPLQRSPPPTRSWCERLLGTRNDLVDLESRVKDLNPNPKYNNLPMEKMHLGPHKS